MKRSRTVRRAALVSALALLVLPMVAQVASAPSQGNGSSDADLRLAASKVAGSPVRPPAPSCGAKIYKASGSAWKCTFADEFSGTSLDSSKWVPQLTSANGFHSGPDCTVNTPNNIRVLGGTLRLTVRKENAPFVCKSPYGDYTTQYTAGGVMTWGTFAQTYGRFEFRAKFPGTKVAGVQTALWMYPTSNNYGAWPASGEIDVTEFYSQYPDRSIPYVHYNTSSTVPPGVTGVTNWNCAMVDPSTFHTYVAEWTSKGIKITFDGQTCLDHTWSPAAPLAAPKPFDKPFAIIMSQILGTGNNALTGSTPLPATTEIDWVRAWS